MGKDLVSEVLSFYQLLTEKNYIIEIPKIQRDYAQGRTTEKTNEVRTNFLNQIKDYLKKYPKKCRNTLDFVYGDVDDKNRLILLDGQQRLTTLFLIHWFTALNAGKYDVFKTTMLTKDNTSRFTYNTRESSKEFCLQLLINGQQLFNSKTNKLSDAIKDQIWFLINWEDDLTIQSMLVMIDAIQETFSDSIDYYDSLTNTENPCIVFNFLPMKSQGLSDELYIKMNSRGRELTRFENLKSKFISELELLDTQKELLKEFSKKIDTDWLDVFWNLRDETKVNHFDDSLLNFLETMFINKCASSDKVVPEKVKYYIDNSLSIPFKEILEYENFVSYITDCVNFLNSITIELDNKTKSLKKYFSQDFVYKEEYSFKNIINHDFKDAAYRERIIFFAYSYYLITNQDIKYFEHWMRIIENLIQSIYAFDRPSEFCNAIQSIKKMLDSAKGQDIYDYLPTSNEDFSGIDKAQLQEEKTKIILMKQNEDWNKSILEAEKQPYFKGQISFALDYSNKEKKKFDLCIEKVFPLFNDSGLCEEAKKNAKLQRALLSISNGQYLMTIGSNKSFLIDNHRDISWKNYLKGDNKQEKEASIRKWFFNLIDDELYNQGDLSCLEKIAQKYKPQDSVWVQKFIDYPELMTTDDSNNNPVKIGNQCLIRKNSDEEIFILSGKQMNSYHTELYSISKYLELKTNSLFESSLPFQKLDYYATSSTEKPCFFFGDWEYKEHDFALDCFYNGQLSFLLIFFDRNNRINPNIRQLPNDIIDVLQKNGFNPRSNNSSDFECTYDFDNINEGLVNLFSAFKEVK